MSESRVRHLSPSQARMLAYLRSKAANDPKQRVEQLKALRKVLESGGRGPDDGAANGMVQRSSARGEVRARVPLVLEKEAAKHLSKLRKTKRLESIQFPEGFREGAPVVGRTGREDQIVLGRVVSREDAGEWTVSIGLDGEELAVRVTQPAGPLVLTSPSPDQGDLAFRAQQLCGSVSDETRGGA